MTTSSDSPGSGNRSSASTVGPRQQGVVGPNYAYQTTSSVGVILKDKVFNPFTGAHGMIADDSCAMLCISIQVMVWRRFRHKLPSLIDRSFRQIKLVA